MNWFKRHSNRALLIALFIGVILYAIADVSSWYVFLRVSSLVFMLTAQVWYLRRKNRSLGWLFLNLIGGSVYAAGTDVSTQSSMFMAGLIMLCLKNKREEILS